MVLIWWVKLGLGKAVRVQNHESTESTEDTEKCWFSPGGTSGVGFRAFRVLRLFVIQRLAYASAERYFALTLPPLLRIF